MNSKETLEKILNSPTPKMRGGSYLDIKIIESIKQDLDRLEKLEKENEQLNQTIQTIQQNTKEEFDHLLDKYYELGDENAKLKKAIEILKENCEIALHYDDEFPTPMISINGVYSYINEEQYKILGEVLFDER